MITKIKTEKYAAKLRKRLAELRAARPKQVVDHKKAVAKWRADLKGWIATNASKRVDAIEVEKRNRYHSYSDRPEFDTSSFFFGAPNPPEPPSDKQIREIQSLLRHLGITGQATVQVSTEDVARLLGESGEASGD